MKPQEASQADEDEKNRLLLRTEDEMAERGTARGEASLRSAKAVAVIVESGKHVN